MKRIRKIALAVLMVFIMSALTACNAGSTIETTLNINEDLTGSRVMSITIADSVFQEYFTGTIEQLNALITEKCPQEMTWVYDESTGSKVYTFTLNFTSPQDYQAKANTILGEGAEATVTINKAESVWANGVYVDESFTSTDLMQWLKTAIVEAGFVSSSNSDKIFQSGSTNVKFGANDYSASDRIDIDEIEYVKINAIHLFTDSKGMDVYDKTIELRIPAASMETKGEEIKAWLKDNVPSGAKAAWEEAKNESIYTVSKDGMTAKELATFLNEYFVSDLCTVEQQSITENMSPFSFNTSLVETVDLSNYLVGDRAYNTTVKYFVKGEDGYVGGRYLDQLARYDETDDVVSDYEGYRYGTVEYDDATLRNCSAYFQKVYRISELNVKSSVGLFGGLKRQIDFTFAVEPTDEEKEMMLCNIEALGAAYDMVKAQEEASTEEAESDVDATEAMEATETVDGTETVEGTEAPAEPEWNVKLEDKVEKGVYTLTITQKGSREDIQASSEALFGNAGDMYRTKDFGFAKLNYAVAVYDNFTFGDFVDYVAEDVKATYTLNTGFLSKVTDTNMNINASEPVATIDGNKVIMDSNILSGVNMITYGTQFNLWALFFYLLILVAIACAILIMKKEGVFDKVQAMIAAKQAVAPVPPMTTAAPVTPAAPAAPVQPEEAPMFCENCGAKRDADALVCTQCGTRFED